MSKIVSLTKFRAQSDEKAAFLGLLRKNIEQNPEQIAPIPVGLLDRMARIREQAEKKRKETELLEG